MVQSPCLNGCRDIDDHRPDEDGDEDQPDEGGDRPLSVSFQFRASGKETDVATPLGLEKYGKIDFSQGKLTKRHPKNGQK